MRQSSLEINGSCDPEFESVRREFIRNFKELDEIGACVCIMLNGEPVVDLWAGVADAETGQAWERDTKAVVWSTTKGLVSMCALILADRGELDLFAPVTKYWPEYGRNGKEGTLVAHLLCQQAGVCVVTETIPRGGVCDWDLMIRMIEDQEPQFAPGTRVGYSPLMYGWLVGEVIRRITGKSLGTFFREEVATPVDADCWIGLPADKEAEVSRMAASDAVFQGDFLDLPGYEITKIVFTNSGGYTDFSRDESGRYLFDTREAHAAEIGGGGGIANARGLARVYSPWANGGMHGDRQIVGLDTIARASMVVSALMTETTLRQLMRFSMGFHKSWDNRSNPAAATVLLSEDAFGFAGNGGSIGFASPAEHLSFGYVMNRMDTKSAFQRAQNLIDATYLKLGYRSNASGAWQR